MRVLTGIQPSGTPHIGNLFGAMLPIIEFSKEHEAFIFIADLHAMTTVHNAQELNQNILNVAMDYLALGLDPENCCFYQQSAIIGHSELAWILGCLTPMSLLERCHSYKDKTARGLEANVGLFYYPVLMAADILLYNADIVPVGQDQKQHVEVTRDLGQKFNNNYQEIFKIPDVKISEETGIIPGIDGQKMSKSYGNTLEIFAPETELRKKIMSIKTDSKGVDEAKDPDDSIICALAKLFMNAEELSVFREKFTTGGTGYGDMKKELADKMLVFLEPYRAKREALAKNPSAVKEILKKGAEKAQKLATEKLIQIKKVVGLAI